MSLPRRLAPVIAGVVSLISLLVPTVGLHPVHAATTIVVNTTAYGHDCTTGPKCSLDMAVALADTHGSGDTITFNIPSSDQGCYGSPVVCHVRLNDIMELTANTTTIDGYTQPGASKNTLGIVAHINPYAGSVTPENLGTNAQIRIQVEGGPDPSNATYDTCVVQNGFDITGHFNTIQGLSMVGFCGAAIYLDDRNHTEYGNTIQGNFLGLQWNGLNNVNYDYGNDYGIYGDNGAFGVAKQPAPIENPVVTDTPSVHGTRLHPAPAAPSLAPAGSFPSVCQSSSNRPATPTANELAHPDVIGGTQNWQLNLIGYNNTNGIRLVQTAGYRISHNLIGTTPNGKNSRENYHEGIRLERVSNVVIGGPSPQYRNIISGNGSSGSPQTESGVDELYSTRVTIAANFLGGAVDGASPLGNRGAGAYLYCGTNNVVGLSPLGTQGMGGGRNMASSNYYYGIRSDYEINPTIQYNWTGISASGLSSLSNDDEGIYLNSNNYQPNPANTDLSGVPGKGAKVLHNVSSGNDGDNIYARYDNYDVFKGNYTGTDYRGRQAILFNENDGIDLQYGYYATVGGTKSGDGNVMSGNYYGEGFAAYQMNVVTVQGNKIGVDVTGQKCVANGTIHPYYGEGIQIENSSAVLVGGATPAAANIVSCNGDEGIYGDNNTINSSLPAPYDTMPYTIQGNYTGTNGPGLAPAGTLHLSNGESGIDFEYSDGAQVLNNTSAFNAQSGISIDQTTARISKNSFYRNGLLGIDLDDDSEIDCPGPANETNTGVTCPVITGATTGGVSGTADPGTVVEVFLADNGTENTDSAHVPKLYGEGQTYLGSATTGPGGHWSVSVPSGTLSHGQSVTATATLLSTGPGTYDQTSEFSQNKQVS